jgi:ATP-binding cassette subfamily F protein uup
VGEYVGGYTDWLRQRPTARDARAHERAAPAATTPQPGVPALPAQKRKLSYKEARELEQLPARIESLEAQVATLTDALGDPSFYTQEPAAITGHNARLAAAQAELDAAYARWAELDA